MTFEITYNRLGIIALSKRIGLVERVVRSLQVIWVLTATALHQPIDYDSSSINHDSSLNLKLKEKCSI